MASATAPEPDYLNEAQHQLSLRNIREAIRLFDKAEDRDASPDECAVGRWRCWMLLAEFENAWRESDRIAARGAPDAERLWDGAPVDGKRVMLRCLHGYGDAIQFIRYAPLLRQKVPFLVVETPPPLLHLFQNLPGVDEVITWSKQSPEHPPAWDSQIEVMELPRMFRTTAETIPRQIPYFHLPPGLIESRRQMLGNRASPAIGINWRASEWDNARSIPFTQLLPLLEMRGLSFYSLQWGPQRKQMQDTEHSLRIQDTIIHSPGILESAAVIANLDLVITVDSMVAHLAGALGRPVLTLLPFQADWRWGINGTATPWYPSMRLFRQPQPGDWGSVIEQAARHLSNLHLSWAHANPGKDSGIRF